MNIDKDKKTLKEIVTELRTSFEECPNIIAIMHRFEKEDIQTISNEILELERQKLRINNLEEENELQHCDLQNAYSINNGLKKELETWKKIAEKLADTLRYYNGMQQVQEFCIDICEDKLCDEENCKQCILDWARKEVEKDE